MTFVAGLASASYIYGKKDEAFSGSFWSLSRAWSSRHGRHVSAGFYAWYSGCLDYSLDCIVNLFGDESQDDLIGIGRAGYMVCADKPSAGQDTSLSCWACSLGERRLS